jgi:putative transposase
MPRKARITVSGVVHHIMARGIDGRDIFIDDDDRIRFLGLLESGIQKSGCKCYAWTLMKNHYHLLLCTNGYPLSAMMMLLGRVS